MEEGWSHNRRSWQRLVEPVATITVVSERRQAAAVVQGFLFAKPASSRDVEALLGKAFDGTF